MTPHWLLGSDSHLSDAESGDPPSVLASSSELPKTGSPGGLLPPTFSHKRHSHRTSMDTNKISFRSTATGRSSARRQMELVEDIYFANPEVWGRQEGQVKIVRGLLEEVTEPPRSGLFDRLDYDHELRVYMEQSEVVVRARWERLLACYDVAMRGRNSAFFALADASNQFYGGEVLNRESQEARRKLTEENEDLSRALSVVESQNRLYEKRIAALEDRNRILAREGIVRQSRYDKFLGILEAMLASWEGSTGIPITRSSADASGDPEARFEAIRRGLEEVRMVSALSTTRYKYLKDKYDALINEADELVQGHVSEQLSPFFASEPDSELSQRKVDNDVLSSSLEAERNREDGKEESSAQIRAQLASQSGSLPSRLWAENDNLREEVALWRGRCAELKRTVEQLKQKTAVQDVEARDEEINDETNAGKAADHIEDLPVADSGPVRRSSDKPDMTSSSCSPPLPLLPGDVLRDIEAGQLQAIQSSQSVMDEIKETIDELVKRISTEMAEAKKMHRLEAEQILDELQKLAISADTWSQEHQTLEENQGLIHGELDALRRMVQSNEQQSPQTGAVQSTSRQSTESSPIAGPKAPRVEPSTVSSYAPSAHEIRHLRLVSVLIRTMRAPPSPEHIGLDTAVVMWLRHLYYLRDELNGVDPFTPTEDLMTKFGAELETLLSYGIQKDPKPFYSTLKHYDKLFSCLEKLGSCRIHGTISAAELSQRTQICLEHELQTYRTQHSLPPLRSDQIEESSNSEWTLPIPESWGSSASIEELLAQIQKVVVDQYLLERRQALQDGIRSQEDQLADLKEAIPMIGTHVENLIEQMAAFDRLHERESTSSSPDAREVDTILRVGLKRREMRFRREQDFTQERCNQLEAGLANSQKFLDHQTLMDRRLAEQALTKALLKLQPCPSQGTTRSCHGLHGHGVLPSADLLGTSLCRILTSLTWLVLLLFTQPRRVYQTAVFIWSSLVAIPIYLSRCIAYAISRLYLRLHHGNAPTPSPPPPSLPRLLLPPVPPASTLLGTALVLLAVYGWLAYVAVTVERRIWVGDNDWRFAYVLDLTSGAPLPYPGWSPLRVDFRLATHPAWAWFGEGVHSLWAWKRGVDLSDVAVAGAAAAGAPRSLLLAAYHRNLFMPRASPSVVWKLLNSLTSQPSLGFSASGTREYCSWAGRLNIRSASTRTRSGRYRNTSSRLACAWTYSMSKSAAKSSPMVLASRPFSGVTTTAKGSLPILGSLAFWRFSGKPSGPTSLASG
ncbi:hypothetical protein C7999DRAFT_41925 [Corynascus novoguineensis]|uniref:Uncharacterized protein n=1 Tax=Corynascus novoguineensis TaxID=1126955 RepID=A0AAN7CSS3_9PEZI|nr:hypothetical protein C7999DRAFT_41925 [Corynascus novoguineensis]